MTQRVRNKASNRHIPTTQVEVNDMQIYVVVMVFMSGDDGMSPFSSLFSLFSTRKIVLKYSHDLKESGGAVMVNAWAYKTIFQPVNLLLSLYIYFFLSFSFLSGNFLSAYPYHFPVYYHPCLVSQKNRKGRRRERKKGRQIGIRSLFTFICS